MEDKEEEKKEGKEEEDDVLLLPPLYPFTRFIYPTLCLLTRKSFVFPFFGMVHTSSYFRFNGPLRAREEYMVRRKEGGGERRGEG